jgi:hypothetical protein
MNFEDELITMPWHIITKVEFKDRGAIITFRSRNALRVSCPEGNDQYEALKAKAIEKLGIEKVTIHDH